MPLILTGIIELTGEHGTGKTTAALECGALPEKIRLYDDDVKGRATVRDFERQTGRKIDYIDTTAMQQQSRRDYEYYEKIKASLDAIQPGQFDVIIFDTWTKIAKACRSYAEKYPEQFKDQVKGGGYFTGTSQMVNGQISRIGRDLEAALINSLESKVQLIFLIAHLKDQYLNNTQTGKQIPDDNDTLERVPSTRIWYRHNPNSGVPISLFLKRPNVKKWNEEKGRPQTINLFPKKITPLPEDESVWDGYERYYHNPLCNRLPTPDETPTPYELSIIEGTLTPDQLVIYKAGTAIAAQQAKQEAAFLGLETQSAKNTDLAIELKQKGTPPPLIAKETGLTIQEILDLKV
jgi:hypothetical protein